MKNMFLDFLGQHKEEDKRVTKTDLNRERLIRFSQKLRKSSSGVIIRDYSVQDEDRTDQFSQSSRASVD